LRRRSGVRPIGDRTHIQTTVAIVIHASCYVRAVSRLSHPLGAGRQRSDAVLHGLIVLTAETIVPLPMHALRLLREVIKNAQLTAQQFSDFLRLEDQASSWSRL
jgi:hypothetical protein